jgi:hypothetical protein
VKSLTARTRTGGVRDHLIVPIGWTTRPGRLVVPLDIDQEIARHGADTRGGIGISVPTG